VQNMAKKQITGDDAIQDMLPLLDQELSRLPDKYRMPIILCDLQGKTRKAAAKQLHLAEKAFSTRLDRARIMLAKRLARHGTTLSGSAVALAVSQNLASASVPPSLVSSTVKVAALVVAGKTGAAAAISAKIAALTEGVVKAMLVTKLKTATLLLLAVRTRCLRQHHVRRWRIGDGLRVGVAGGQGKRRAGVLAARGTASSADVLINLVRAVVHDPDIAYVGRIDCDTGRMGV
jgi:hypothetical protein